MTLTYTPEGRPSQLLRDLLKTYWDARTGGQIPLPNIIERPLPEFQRIDTRNEGDTITVSMEGFTERLIHVGFKNREIESSMAIDFNVFTSRQRLYDMIQETRRIIFSKQHNPTDYLLDNFETYANTTALRAVWTAETNTTATLLTSASQFGTKSMRLVQANGDGGIYRALPATTSLIPRPYPDRLRQIRFYAKINSGSATVGVRLRDASNRAGTGTGSGYREWTVTIDSTTFNERIVDFSETVATVGNDWDASLIDEIAFTSLDNGSTIDIDHIDLGTNEFQFLEYGGYDENLDVFNYFSGRMRATYKSVGDPVDEL
jgi:hypothetical protein